MSEGKPEGIGSHAETGETGLPELDRRKTGLRNWVEKQVLGQNDRLDENVNDAFAEFSPRERTDLLYEKLMAYTLTKRLIQEEKQEHPDSQPEPVDPYLITEIHSLWGDEKTQEMFVDRFAQARLDARMQRHSTLGNRWRDINERIALTQQSYEDETRNLFLQQINRPDLTAAARGRAQRFAKSLIDAHRGRDNIIHLEGLPPTTENTDIAAGIMYETLARYHNQAEDGFVWLPSRTAIHDETIASLQNGRWPVLRGEAGTGKSEQANAAAVVLTGEQPTHIACGPNTASKDLIVDRDIDEEGSYETYGPAMQAATGFDTSRQDESTVTTGRIVRFDESGKLGAKGYSEIKELRQKRPATQDDIRKIKQGKSIDIAKTLHGKPILPGFAAIFTTNPEGIRYPDRSEPDAALRRELSYITVDYPEMSRENPELYEFMLATLMNDNKHIPVAREELSPAYRTEYPQDKTLPDGRKIISQQELIADPTDQSHGSLYRLSFAIRALQDAFNNGNKTTIPQDALRYNLDDDGAIKIVQNGGEPLTLSNSTITLGEVASWMKGYQDRRLKDDPAFQTDNLTEWMHLKLKGYINQSNEEDREKIQAIFDHFHLFSPPPDLTDAQPILPKEIGYLSPRVPRPVEVQEVGDKAFMKEISIKKPKDLHLNEDISCVLEDGTTVLARPEPYEFEKYGWSLHLKNGTRFLINKEKYRYVGVIDDEHIVVKIETGHADEALHKIVEIQDAQYIVEVDPRVYELQQQESEAWKTFLGKAIEIPDPPQELVDYLDRKEQEGETHLEAHYWPGDAVEFKQDSAYPGWGAKPNDWYWAQKASGEVSDYKQIAKAQWIVIEGTQKPKENDSSNQMYEHDPYQIEGIVDNLRRRSIIPRTDNLMSRYNISCLDLYRYVLPNVGINEGLDPEQVQLPTAIQYNVLTNMHHPEWGQTDTSEWLASLYGIAQHLIGGSKHSNIFAEPTERGEPYIGFRPMILFPQEFEKDSGE